MTDIIRDLITLLGAVLVPWLAYRRARGDKHDRALASRTVRTKTAEIQTMRRRHRRELEQRDQKIQQRDATIRRLRRQLAAKESIR